MALRGNKLRPPAEHYGTRAPAMHGILEQGCLWAAPHRVCPRATGMHSSTVAIRQGQSRDGGKFRHSSALPAPWSQPGC